MVGTHAPTAMLGRFASEWAQAELPAPVADKAGACLLDGVGLALIARDEPTAAAVRSLLPRVDDAPRAATVWADGESVGTADAVLANAVAIHAQFHDDSDNDSWSHPASFIVPVCLALGESGDMPLARVLNAIAVGYAATAWVGAKERVARALIERGLRTTPTIGTLGAAAAASTMLALDAQAAASAIGMAASLTGGVLEPVGSGADEWRVQAAQAARTGMLSASLAQRGVTGSPQGLEGRNGFLRALAGLQTVPPEWAQPPSVELILGICAKPFATLGDNMSAVLAARELHRAAVDHRRIRRVRVRIWTHYVDYPGTGFRGPFERTIQALASMAFSTAAMLVYGELEYDKPCRHRDDPDILRIVPLIDIEPDDDGNPYDADVTVELDDGSSVTRRAAQAPRSLLFHDRPTAIALFEQRLAGSGADEGRGSRLAQQLYRCVDGAEDIGCREFIRMAVGRH